MANNNAAINPLGGPTKIVISEVTLISNVWTVTTPVNGTTGIDLGLFNTAGYDSTPGETNIPNDALQNVYTQVAHNPVIEGILMQRAKVNRDFLRYTTQDKYYLLYFYQGIVNGKRQEELSVGQVVPQDNNSFPNGATTTRFKFNKIVHETNLTIAAATLDLMEAAYTFTAYNLGTWPILANRFDLLVETTVV